jgi:hypothetical protein
MSSFGHTRLWMTRIRTSASSLVALAVDGLVAALEPMGFEVEPRQLDAATGDGSTIVTALVNLKVDDRTFSTSVMAMDYCRGQTAQWLTNLPVQPENTIKLLVADRITAQARRTLSDARWSWLDRRGWLHVLAPGVRLDLAVPETRRTLPSTVRSAIRGRSGRTIAYWLCSHPGETLSPRRASGFLRQAPSTISMTVKSLADAGLVDEAGAGIAPELFWELAAVWRTDRTWLRQSPDPNVHVPADPDSPSWWMTGVAAAARYGAPVAAPGKGPIELYVPGPVEISVGTRNYGAAESGTGVAVIAVPPTPLVTDPDGDEDVPMIDGWPAAPVVAVALDLAQDRTLGREILEDWSAGHGIWN